MEWLLNGITANEVPRDLSGQTLWLVNGWTTASGGAVTVLATPAYKPIILIY